MGGKDKSYFDNASLIDSGSLQVSCRFPNLYKEGGNKNIGFWKIIYESWGFHGHKLMQSA